MYIIQIFTLFQMISKFACVIKKSDCRSIFLCCMQNRKTNGVGRLVCYVYVNLIAKKSTRIEWPFSLIPILMGLSMSSGLIRWFACATPLALSPSQRNSLNIPAQKLICQTRTHLIFSKIILKYLIKDFAEKLIFFNLKNTTQRPY